MPQVLSRKSESFNLSPSSNARPGIPLKHQLQVSATLADNDKAVFQGMPHTAPACCVEDSSPSDVRTLDKSTPTLTAEPSTKPLRKRNKVPRVKDQPVPLEKLKWLSIAQTSLRYPSFSEKALRHLVAQSEAYQRHPKSGLKSNGFITCIVRPAGQRKILIDADAFEQWLRSWAVAK